METSTSFRPRGEIRTRWATITSPRNIAVAAILLAPLLLTRHTGFEDRTKRSVVSAANALPSFIANEGQLDAAVRFEWRHSRGTTYFMDKKIVHYLQGSDGSGSLGDAAGVDGVTQQKETCSREVTMAFVEPSSTVEAVGKKRQPSTVSYAIGNDDSRWRSAVATFGEVHYAEIYPGVRLVFGRSANALKGTFEVAPGVDVSSIRWRYVGSPPPTLAADGSLAVALPNSRPSDGPALREAAPVAWQVDTHGRQHRIDIAFRVAADGTVGLDAGAYDPQLPLVIDPTIKYVARIGESHPDKATALDVNASGEVVVVGNTESCRFPNGKPPDATQKSDRGHTDVFVSLLDPQGRLIRTNFLGSETKQDSFAKDVLWGDETHVYVVGNTVSSNFPITEGRGINRKVIQPSRTNETPAPDMFIVKLDIRVDRDFLHRGAKGDPLPLPPHYTYSTYFGGNDRDEAAGIALDANDNLVIVGRTTSTTVFKPQPDNNLPRSAKAPLVKPALENNRGGWDMVIATINPTGDQILNGTLIGGTGDDRAEDVALGPDGRIWVAGTSTSTDICRSNLCHPSPGQAIPPLLREVIDAPNTGVDGILLALDPILGSSSTPPAPPVGPILEYARLGGGLGDAVTSMALADDGSVTLSGHTISNDFLAPNLLPTHNRAGQEDAFAVRIDTAQDTLRIRWVDVWAKSSSPLSKDFADALAVDARGYTYVTGHSNGGSQDFDITSFPRVRGTGDSVYLRVIAPDDGRLVFSARAGPVGTVAAESSGNDVVARDGDVWVAGFTKGELAGTPAPTPPGMTLSDGDAFVLRISDLPIPTPTPTSSSTSTSTAPATRIPTASPTATTAPTRTLRPPTPTQVVYQLALPMLFAHDPCPPQFIYSDVALVIDSSTSMLQPSGSPGKTMRDVAEEAALTFVDGFLGDERSDRLDQLAIISFDSRAFVLAGLRRDRDALKRAVRKAAEPRVGSALDDGMLMAIDHLKTDDNARLRNRKAIVVLSDGIVVDSSGEVSGSSEAAVRAMSIQARADGIRIFVVGVGTTINTQLLRTIAWPRDASADYYYESYRADRLTEIYQRLTKETRCLPGDYWR